MSRLCVLFLLTIEALIATQAEGQIIRRLRERRAAALATAEPGAPVAPLPRLRGLLARRLQAQEDLVAQEDSKPTPASPDQRTPENPQQNLVAGRAASALKQVTAFQNPQIPNFSLAELAELDINGLQSALENVDGALQNELNRFSSAESWQGFLDLPPEVLDDEAVDIEALEVSLDRFNRVAANPAFSQISGLASFVQTRGILAELANRTMGPQLNTQTETSVSSEASQVSAQIASTAENLPAPQPESEPARPVRENKGERSILVRTE